MHCGRRPQVVLLLLYRVHPTLPVLRAVICGVVLVVSCVVLFLLCVCVCDLFLFFHPRPPLTLLGGRDPSLYCGRRPQVVFLLLYRVHPRFLWGGLVTCRVLFARVPVLGLCFLFL